VTIVPTTILDTTYNIVIEFPDVYDKRLGTKVSCKKIRGFNSEVTCITKNRKVYITGISEYIPSQSNPA
jgi:hypothetical protein